MIPWQIYADYLEDKGFNTNLFRIAEPKYEDDFIFDASGNGYDNPGDVDGRNPSYLTDGFGDGFGNYDGNGYGDAQYYLFGETGYGNGYGCYYGDSDGNGWGVIESVWFL